jgi:rare lipoprotein A
MTGRSTARTPGLPLGSHVRVTNLRNGRSILVMVNDRGPFIPGRLIDLSKGAAQAIGIHQPRSGVRANPGGRRHEFEIGFEIG